MIVADANLVGYLLVDGPSTPDASRARAKDRIWAVPDFLRHELLSLLSRYVITGAISRDEAIKHWRRGLSIVHESQLRSDPVAVMNMVAQSGCSTYDVEYVWLAQELDVPLVTADNEVLEAFPHIAVSIKQFAAD